MAGKKGVMAMKLVELLESLGLGPKKDLQLKDIDILGIQKDSRKIKKGDLFVAISGYESDGHRYIAEAIENGAVAVVGELDISLDIPYVKVSDSRIALGKLASTFYGFPSKSKTVIGVTGTNGKTTVAFMIRHILESAGRTASLLGTVAYMINNEVYKPENTTPDALLLQELLSKSEDEFAILEVSSHALVQGRAEGLEIDYGLFTNLSHDHLDYHQTMDEYFQAKISMFDYLKPDGRAVISVLSEWGERLSTELQNKEIPFSSLACNGEHDLNIEDIILNGKTTFTLRTGGHKYQINLPCPGRHNVYNAALAFLTALNIGLAPQQIIRALEHFPGVPGRFEMVPHPSGATFIIDYAHTQDAIEYCLQTAKEHNARHITHIYGFRGGRDDSKREHMVRASSGMCDKFILTFDDLNGVPEEEMMGKLHHLNARFGQDKGLVIPDRTMAIQKAWNLARDGDWVIITGKGPEEYKSQFQLPVSSDKEALVYLQRESTQEQFA
jgi:UDP-N-acetylmuramoyl-L-alanyl-D-glutamate--2,6-diaminopimelate ligase